MWRDVVIKQNDFGEHRALEQQRAKVSISSIVNYFLDPIADFVLFRDGNYPRMNFNWVLTKTF